MFKVLPYIPWGVIVKDTLNSLLYTLFASYLLLMALVSILLPMLILGLL
jgi:hypothetical protein